MPDEEMPLNIEPVVKQPEHRVNKKHSMLSSFGIAKKKKMRSYKSQTDLLNKDQGPFTIDARKVVEKIGELPGSIESDLKKVERGECQMLESGSAVRQARDILIDTMNKIGLDPKSMAIELKEAIHKAKTEGKAYYNRDGTVQVCPDLNALKNLLFLWGAWTGVGRINATSIANASFNFTGLDETSRQRVGSLIGLLEAEVKRRGLTDVPAGDSQAKDAEALPGMVEPGSIGDSITH